jgi:hypothetical protein
LNDANVWNINVVVELEIKFVIASIEMVKWLKWQGIIGF